jgi:hypothetical protein
MPKYRSKLEERVAGILDPSWHYEPYSREYITFRKYTPDFVWADEVDEAWLEVKGYFRPGDTAKYKAIRAAYPDIRLVFVFSHPHQPVRKGAKLTMAGWAEKEGWGWTTPSDIEEEGI